MSYERINETLVFAALKKDGESLVWRKEKICAHSSTFFLTVETQNWREKTVILEILSFTKQNRLEGDIGKYLHQKTSSSY